MISINLLFNFYDMIFTRSNCILYIFRVSLSFSPTSHRDSRPFALPGLSEMKADRGSYTSLQSNPFDDTANSSIRASTRKKRRAPLPPVSHISTPLSTIPNITVSYTQN